MNHILTIDEETILAHWDREDEYQNERLEKAKLIEKERHEREEIENRVHLPRGAFDGILLRHDIGACGNHSKSSTINMKAVNCPECIELAKGKTLIENDCPWSQE